MNIKHLQYFVVLAEEQHYQRAAERLKVDQSPLSRAIKALEAELRVKLFDRTSRGTRITPVGVAFLDDAKRILGAVEQGWRTLQNTSVYSEPLRLVLSDTTIGLANLRLSRWLTRLRESLTDVDLRLVELSYGDALRDVRSGIADVAIVQSGHGNGTDLKTLTLWHDPLVAVLPREHELAREEELRLQDFLRYPLIDCSPNSEAASSAVIHDYLAQQGADILSGEYACTVLGMVTLVASGFGLGFASSHQMEILSHPEVITRPFVDAGLAFSANLIYRDETPSVALQALIAWCEANIETLSV
ncbi:LysR family transcriptional regulator [Alcaligenes faecalis]|uniref:LysR family transcriptional regulator n=1 Tax=Alcaligenes faecalis TaxID=511 RepID=UPI001EF107F3|nr:LysR family transcriptional regulator [Alcaligenes faecalis]ULH06445.1 LysR family transcriptional regulator [Alcaligenes faecalis]